jgi:hypothetical protein
MALDELSRRLQQSYKLGQEAAACAQQSAEEIHSVAC